MAGACVPVPWCHPTYLQSVCTVGLLDSGTAVLPHDVLSLSCFTLSSLSLSCIHSEPLPFLGRAPFVVCFPCRSNEFALFVPFSRPKDRKRREHSSVFCAVLFDSFTQGMDDRVVTNLFYQYQGTSCIGHKGLFQDSMMRSCRFLYILGRETVQPISQNGTHVNLAPASNKEKV